MKSFFSLIIIILYLKVSCVTVSATPPSVTCYKS